MAESESAPERIWIDGDATKREGATEVIVPSPERLSNGCACYTCRLQRERDGLRRQRDELLHTVDLQNGASMRAVERWRAEDPEGRKLTLPDLSNHLVWAFETLAETTRERDEAAEEIVELLADRDALVRQRDELAEALREVKRIAERRNWRTHLKHEINDVVRQALAKEEGGANG